MNYYNEFDKHAAKWLRNLIKGGMIPAGDVDDRSIEDVRPDDLRGYTQCHFFAGIGGWPLALQMAGWAADRPVWTGSCPCQSFSTAGKRKGTSDKRHLWPGWYELIKACKPSIIFGEQVEAAIGHGWLDLVSDDLARQGYEIGAAVLPACSVGAYHIRKRLWFMAHANMQHQQPSRDRSRAGDFGWQSKTCSMAHSLDTGSQGGIHWWPNQERETQHGHAGRNSATGSMDLSQGPRHECRKLGDETEKERQTLGSGKARGWRNDPPDASWSEPDWIWCRDGKYRPIEPGTLPLAHGLSQRVVKIRGYGNAIVPQVAAEFIKTGMAYIEEQP